MLEVKLANNGPKNKPTLENAINGKSYIHKLKNGNGLADIIGLGSKSGASNRQIALPEHLISEGFNRVTRTVINGDGLSLIPLNYFGLIR